MWQVFYASIAIVAYFICQGISCGICFLTTLFMADFKLIHVRVMQGDFLASIAFVADFMCQSIYCGI